MTMEEMGQVKVGVEIEVLWRTLAKDLNSLLPTNFPTLVKGAEILQGDSGFGTVYLFKFGLGCTEFSYRIVKVVEYDESILQIGLQVIEEGRLVLGFTLFQTLVLLWRWIMRPNAKKQMPSGEALMSGIVFIELFCSSEVLRKLLTFLLLVVGRIIASQS